MSARQRHSLTALILESLAEADDALKRELAAYLRPYLADGPGRLLDAGEKARQLGLHPETLVKMARAGRCKGAVKVGREWRFPSESVEILPPAPGGAPGSSRVRSRPRRPPETVPGSVAAIRGRR
jgi:excisionase family DNA binding protein